MVFNIKTQILLKKDFKIEAETPKEALEEIKRQVYKSVDLESLEIEKIVYDLSDPSFRVFNANMCKGRIAKYKKKK